VDGEIHLDRERRLIDLLAGATDRRPFCLTFPFLLRRLSVASSLVLTIKTERADPSALAVDSSLDVEGMTGLVNFLEACVGGHEHASVDVQYTDGTAPVAASGTWTLASVVATDVASVGGVDFTFTSTPSAETDVEVDVPSAKAFASSTDISTATGTITETAHGYETGDVGRLTTSGSLPTGFATSTDYFVIKVSDNAYRLAASLANAQAGTQIVPSAAGSGNQTFTLTANTYVASKLAAAVNAHSTISKLVRASYAANVVTVTARQKGVCGNFIQFSDGDSTITSSGSGYLTGGTGGATSTAVTYSCAIA
jgi:hypothetical protein